MGPFTLAVDTKSSSKIPTTGEFLILLAYTDNFSVINVMSISFFFFGYMLVD